MCGWSVFFLSSSAGHACMCTESIQGFISYGCYNFCFIHLFDENVNFHWEKWKNTKGQYQKRKAQNSRSWEKKLPYYKTLWRDPVEKMRDSEKALKSYINPRGGIKSSQDSNLPEELSTPIEVVRAVTIVILSYIETRLWMSTLDAAYFTEVLVSCFLIMFLTSMTFDMSE